MPTDLVDSPFSIADAVLAYKPGIPGDQVAAAGALFARGEGLDPRGVHMHLPRHAADPHAWVVAMRAYAALIAELAAAAGGWRPREIDVGGGFPSARDPAGRALARRAGAPPPPPIEAFAAAVGSELAAALQAAGIAVDGVVLEAEPGRSLYGDAGVHLTRVLSVKRQIGAGSVHVDRDRHERGVPAGRAARAQRLDRARRRRGWTSRPRCTATSWAARAASTCWPPASSCPRSRPATCSRSSIPAPIRTPRRATSTRCRDRRPCSSAATATRSSSGARRSPTCSPATSRRAARAGSTTRA